MIAPMPVADSSAVNMLALPIAAEFPSKGFVHGFRKFAKLAKAAVLLLVLKGVADGLVRSSG